MLVLLQLPFSCCLIFDVQPDAAGNLEKNFESVDNFFSAEKSKPATGHRSYQALSTSGAAHRQRQIVKVAMEA